MKLALIGAALAGSMKLGWEFGVWLQAQIGFRASLGLWLAVYLLAWMRMNNKSAD